MQRRSIPLQIARRIVGRPDDQHDLADLALGSGQSRFAVQRRFLREVGETPRQFTERHRLERAAAMLGSTSQSVLIIALEVGFNSHEVFTRRFRRAFGCTPTEFRKRSLMRTSAGDGTAHAGLVGSIGPCLRLYRMSPERGQGALQLPDLKITIETVPDQAILFIQREIPRNQLQALFADCFPRIFQHCIRSGHSIAGQPVARYISTGDGLWTIDCAIPVAEPAAGEGEIKAGKLRAGPAAFAVHSGAYDNLPETNAAIDLWIRENGYRRDGAPWECYVTSPAECPDVADWRTHVFWPLANPSEPGDRHE